MEATYAKRSRRRKAQSGEQNSAAWKPVVIVICKVSGFPRTEPSTLSSGNHRREHFDSEVTPDEAPRLRINQAG